MKTFPKLSEIFHPISSKFEIQVIVLFTTKFILFMKLCYVRFCAEKKWIVALTGFCGGALGFVVRFPRARHFTLKRVPPVPPNCCSKPNDMGNQSPR